MQKRGLVHMKRKYAAVCAAAMLLLTSCGSRDIDLSEYYPEYFKYSVGEDAVLNANTSKDKINTYVLHYTGADGEEHRCLELVRPFENMLEWDKENFLTAEEYYGMVLERLVYGGLKNIFERTFTAQVTDKYFADAEENVELSVSAFCVVGGQEYFPIHYSEPLGKARMAAHLSAENGWQLSKADWKTIAADEEWFVFVTCRIPPEADAAAYTEKMQAVYEEYRAAAVEPQSYAFSLGITDGDSAEIIWSELAAFGEEYEYDENSYFGYDMTQAEKLREAYAQ